MTTSEHAEQAPIITLADSFVGGDPVNALAIVLMKAWGKADPNSGVSQHPASYTANFADMARAALASTPSPAQPTEANVPLEEGPATIRMMPESPETSQRHWSMYCDECDIEEGMADSATERWLVKRVYAHNHEMHSKARLAPSPVQGADDRLAQALHDATVEASNKLSAARGTPPTPSETQLRALRDAARAFLATYQQSPQAALNEVRAKALEDASWAHMQDTRNPAEVRDMLRARAAELRAAPQTGAGK